MNLADVLLAREQVSTLRLVYGTVTDDSPLTVTVGASTVATAATALAGYTPTIGDYVAILVQGADRLVLGDI